MFEAHCARRQLPIPKTTNQNKTWFPCVYHFVYPIAKTLWESIVSVLILTEINSPGFLIAEFFGDHFTQLESQSIRDLLRQIRMRTAAKNLYIWHSWLIRGAYIVGVLYSVFYKTL